MPLTLARHSFLMRTLRRAVRRSPEGILPAAPRRNPCFHPSPVGCILQLRIHI